MKKSNLLASALSLFFTVGLFAFANAQVTVTAVNNNNVCPQLMFEFNKLGSFGPEVVKLQNFLNQYNGAKLNGLGYFGPVTQQEVKNFQYTYGIKPTGYQHILTTNMINDLNCNKVAKKERKVFVAKKIAMLANTVSMSAPVISNNYSMNNVNNKAKDLVKEYVTNKAQTIPTLTGDTKNPKDMKATFTMATQTSFWANLQNDWNKIKDNYKAYLLVFALVLALFWFLRKAATE